MIAGLVLPAAAALIVDAAVGVGVSAVETAKSATATRGTSREVIVTNPAATYASPGMPVSVERVRV